MSDENMTLLEELVNRRASCFEQLEEYRAVVTKWKGKVAMVEQKIVDLDEAIGGHKTQAEASAALQRLREIERAAKNLLQNASGHYMNAEDRYALETALDVFEDAALSSPEGVQVCSIQTDETSGKIFTQTSAPDAAQIYLEWTRYSDIEPSAPGEFAGYEIQSRYSPSKGEWVFRHAPAVATADLVEASELGRASSPVCAHTPVPGTGQESRDQICSVEGCEIHGIDSLPLPEEVTGERGEAPSESAGEDFTLTATSASSGSETLTTGLAGLSNEASDQTSNSPKQLCEAE